METLTVRDWEILNSFNGQIINTDEIFKKIKKRVGYQDMKRLLFETKNSQYPENNFHILLTRMPHSLSYDELESLYRIFLLEDWHHDHDNILLAFRSFFNKNSQNIMPLFQRVTNIPSFYKNDPSLSDPFIIKCIAAIAAQPNPENINILSKLTNYEHETIRDYAKYKLEKLTKGI